MRPEGLALPPFREMAASLRRTTEHLAREIVEPSDSPPDWSELDWAVARASAAMQGISTLLANRLHWSGPTVWRAFLEEQREQSELCHARIGSLLDRIDDVMRRAQIGGVAMKGAALRTFGFYRAGERPMGDIDLLVHPEDVAFVERALRSLDFIPAYTTRRHAVFEPRERSVPPGFGEHIKNPIRIEVHTSVAEALPVRKVDITGCLWSASVEPGLNAYPNVAPLLLHILLHSAGNMRAHALRQLQLNDIAALSRRLDGAGWQLVLAKPGSFESRWWVYPPLALTERYYAGSIPADVLRESRVACPRALRVATDRHVLTDVSWSNLRIHAFPGIAWSQTPLEALRFMRSRLLPGRTALAELAVTRQNQPQLYRIPWYGISHGKRILRWLFSRPPRVQTITSLRAALEHGVNSRD